MPKRFGLPGQIQSSPGVRDSLAVIGDRLPELGRGMSPKLGPQCLELSPQILNFPGEARHAKHEGFNFTLSHLALQDTGLNGFPTFLLNLRQSAAGIFLSQTWMRASE